MTEEGINNQEHQRLNVKTRQTMRNEKAPTCKSVCNVCVGGGKGVSETNTAATVKYKWQREQKPAPAPWSVTSFTDHNPDIN